MNTKVVLQPKTGQVVVTYPKGELLEDSDVILVAGHVQEVQGSTPTIGNIQVQVSTQSATEGTMPTVVSIANLSIDMMSKKVSANNMNENSFQYASIFTGGKLEEFWAAVVDAFTAETNK